jgi:hypothetical protein
MYRTPAQMPTERQWWTEGASGISVPTFDVERILGRPYAWPPTDDAALRAAVLADGGPNWAVTARSFLDADGWCLKRPARG